VGLYLGFGLENFWAGGFVFGFGGSNWVGWLYQGEKIIEIFGMGANRLHDRF